MVDVDDDRPVISQQHAVRHIFAFPTLDRCAKKERLRDDSADLVIPAAAVEERLHSYPVLFL